MLRPAAESLRRVFENVRRADPDLYARINTSGSLCVRRIRGTANSLSTHSYGLALDLNIDGHLDNFTDGKTQLGLTILADFFREEGWVWGAGFRREDSMIREGFENILDSFWLALFPSIVILIVVFALNLLGDGLRDALDPRLRGEG